MRAGVLVLVLAGCRQLAGLHDLDEQVDGAIGNRGELAPSNEVHTDHGTAQLPGVTVNDIAVFDADTGQISGAITRAPGEGIVGTIRYGRTSFGGTELAVFEMGALTVAPSGVIKLTGSRAVVFVVETTAKIEGKLDGGGGCADVTQRGCAGPGGGAGATASTAATGCSPGQPGTTNLGTGADTGGSGGGAGGSSGAGGVETIGTTIYPGGASAPRCMTSELEPLLGGGGGGGGGKGTAPQGAAGGGGGGAFQLSAFTSIAVTGVITMGGAGGEGGPRDPGGNNGGAGGGGGGGGSILLEAPVVSITGVLAANGGGGGGASALMVAGQPGQNGLAGAVPAIGGAGGGSGGSGGAGGALRAEAEAGASTNNVNSGAGGGGYGRIFLRASDAPLIAGATVSPPPGIGTIRTQ